MFYNTDQTTSFKFLSTNSAQSTIDPNIGNYYDNVIYTNHYHYPVSCNNITSYLSQSPKAFNSSLNSSNYSSLDNSAAFKFSYDLSENSGFISNGSSNFGSNEPYYNYYDHRSDYSTYYYNTFSYNFMNNSSNNDVLKSESSINIEKNLQLDEKDKLELSPKELQYSKIGIDQSTPNYPLIGQNKKEIKKPKQSRNILVELDCQIEQAFPKDQEPKRRLRTAFSTQQRYYLLSIFEKTIYPTREILEEASKHLDVSISTLQTWFKNTRSKQKKLTNTKNL